MRSIRRLPSATMSSRPKLAREFGQRATGGAMAYRSFLDDDVEWEVWEVQPMSSERRYLADRRHRPRTSEERRRHLEGRRMIERSYLSGWLAFRAAGDQRRRLIPVPEDWFEMDDCSLRGLLERAVPSVRPRARRPQRDSGAVPSS
jgi:hypothetical protein